MGPRPNGDFYVLLQNSGDRILTLFLIFWFACAMNGVNLLVFFIVDGIAVIMDMLKLN